MHPDIGPDRPLLTTVPSVLCPPPASRMSGKGAKGLSGKGAKGAKGLTGDKKKPISRSLKAGLQFPVGRIHRFLKARRCCLCLDLN